MEGGGGHIIFMSFIHQSVHSCHSVTPLKPVNRFQRIFWGLISYSPLLFFFIQRFESDVKYH